MPATFAALRLATVMSLLTVVFTEFLAARRGLGQRLITATQQFTMDEVAALMVILALLALLLTGLVGLVEKRLLRWQVSSGSTTVASM